MASPGPSSARACLVLLGALVLGACATPARKAWVLTAAPVREPPLRDLHAISTYPQAAAATLDVMQRDLAMPAPEVKLIFLPGSKDVEALLLRTGNPPALARASARQVTAIGGHRVIVINQARLERGGWPSRISILAHEYGHVLQYELGDGTRGNSAQWLREGFAEWLSASVMARLKGEDGGKARKRALMRIALQAQGLVPVIGRSRRLRFAAREGTWAWIPPLGSLASFADWLEQSSGEAGPILPDYALVAVDLLREKHGMPAVLRYFELFASRQDAAANFLDAFGESEEQFDRHLRGSVLP